MTFRSSIFGRRPILGALLAGAVALTPMALPAYAADGATSTYDAVKDYTVEKKKDFVDWYQRQMTSLDEQYNKATANLKTGGKDAKRTWKAMQKDIAKKRKVADRKLAAARKASAKTWDKAKKDASDALDDLKDSYNKALDKAKTGK